MTDHVEMRKAEIRRATQERLPKIECDVPIPPKGRDGRPQTELGKLVRQMEPGNSILLDCEAMADRARYIAKSVGFKTMRRKQEDGFRMWRLPE